jgi:hypothetical protein
VNKDTGKNPHILLTSAIKMNLQAWKHSYDLHRDHWIHSTFNNMKFARLYASKNNRRDSCLAVWSPINNSIN